MTLLKFPENCCLCTDRLFWPKIVPGVGIITDPKQLAAALEGKAGAQIAEK